MVDLSDAADVALPCSDPCISVHHWSCATGASSKSAAPSSRTMAPKPLSSAASCLKNSSSSASSSCGIGCGSGSSGPLASVTDRAARARVVFILSTRAKNGHSRARFCVGSVAASVASIVPGGDGGKVGGGGRTPGGAGRGCSPPSETRLRMAITSSDEHVAGSAIAWLPAPPCSCAALAAASALASARMLCSILSTHFSQLRWAQPPARAACAGVGNRCGSQRYRQAICIVTCVVALASLAPVY